MDFDATCGFNPHTQHVILILPNDQELEERQVPTSETLWSILSKFESAFNENLCQRRNNEGRFEVPQIMYNTYPFALSLKELLSTKLTDITKHRKNKTDAIRLRIIFKAQSFSLNELHQKLSQIEKQLKKEEKEREASMDIDEKQEKDDDDDDKALSDDFAKDIDPKEAQSTSETLRKMEILLYKLTKSFENKEAFVKCMKLLRKIVNNLILHSAEDGIKYRKLNLKNVKLQNAVFKYESALDLLRLIGFEESDSNLIIKKENEKLVIFSAFVVKINNCSAPKESVPMIDKEIKVYVLDDLRRFKAQESRLIVAQNAKKNESESSLASKHRIAAQNAYKKAHPTALMGHDLREKMYGVKQKDYKYTLIHVEFPSKYVLESKFHPNCAISKLFEFVDSVLDESISRIKYELLLPPRQVIKNERDDKQTFKSMGGMIPASTVRFVIGEKYAKKVEQYNGKYIKYELIQKYLTKNITSMRAQNKTQSTNDNNKHETKQNSNENQKKSKAMSVAQFKAMKRTKALQSKLAKLDK